MKQKIKLRHRVLAGFLAIAMLIVAVPVLGLSSIAPTTQSRVADPSTMDNWKQYFGSHVLSTANAGGIWTDKSVFTDASAFNGLITMDDPNNNFLVALSAIASNKSIVGYSHIPTDTMLVLDVSGSMNDDNNDAVDELVAAANAAIKELQATNRYNRVGVVLYSGNSTSDQAATTATATVLLPLGRYSHSTDTYLVNTVTTTTQTTGGPNGGPGGGGLQTITTTTEKVTVNSGVTNQSGAAVAQSSKTVEGGTYIQNGIWQAMEELLAVEDITIEGEGFQAGTKRMPIMVLMSDGAPTVATDDFAGTTDRWGNTSFGSSNIGNGSSTNDTMGFLTQLTASYAKAKIEEHYDNNALFYTLGFGVGSDAVAVSVLNPEKSTTGINSDWEAYLALKDDEYLVLSNQDNNTRSVARNDYATEQYYVDQYFTASSTSDLEAVFKTIIQQIIIQSLYYPTLVGTTTTADGYIQFIDDIGDYMEVKSIKGIVLGDTLFSGEQLAQNFREGGGLLGTVDSPNDLGDEMVWAVVQRLGINRIEKYDTYEKQVAEARALIVMAYEYGQLSYTPATDTAPAQFSNYIGWYADANGTYLGFWDASHAAEDAPDGAAYVNKSYGMLGEVEDGYRQSDMMYVSIQVHTEIATGHSEVIWKIPASLIPVVTYNVSLTGESLDDPGDITIEIDDADPIRLVFEVGLRSDLTVLNIAEKLGDAHRNEDGTYTFYTNAWSQEAHDDESLMPSEAINTVAFFEPSEENERYYYNENTTIYQLVGSEYIKYIGTAAPEGDGFYRQVNIFEITDAETGAAVLKTEYEAVTAQAQAAALQSEDGSWYVPMGTVRRTTADIEESKSANETGTLPHAFCLGIEQHIDTDLSDGDDSYYYADTILGNNGKLTVSPATGIVISKIVDDTVTDADAVFTFYVESEDVTDGIYLAVYESADGSQTQGLVTFRNGISDGILLKAGESVYIVGVDACSYTVAEDISGDYKVKTINGVAADSDNATTVEVEQNALVEVIFENTVKSSGNVILSKTVEHPLGSSYEIPANLSFEFEITITDAEGNPRANKTYHTATGSTIVTDDFGMATVKLHAGQSIRLNDLTETDIVTVREINLPDGFTAKETQLSASVSAATNAVLAFVNTYDPEKVDPVNVTVRGTKELVGRDWLDSDVFTFELQRYDRSAVTWNRIGTAQTVTRADPTFDFTAILRTETYTQTGIYHYRIVEVYDANAAIGGISYDTNPRYFNVVVTDSDMDGMLEITEVNSPGSATVVYDDGGLVWNVDTSFTNSYAPTGSAGITVLVDKVVESLNGAEISLAGFEFGLFEGDTLMGETVFTAADGSAQIKLVYNAPDCGNTYTYILKEIPGDLPGMTYTDTVYVIEVTVVDNLDGTIGAVVYSATTDGTVPEGAGTTYSATFTNTYDLSGTTVTVEGNKVLTGRDLAKGEFSFELYQTGADFAIDGLTAIEIKQNGADGSFKFAPFTFDRAGTYYYAVIEQAGELGGVTYDSTVYCITVIVSDNGDGTLVARTIITNSEGTTAPIVFVNAYEAEDADVSLSGTKTLTGRDLKAGEFSFSLFATDSGFSITGLTALETVSNAANGSFAFTKLTYDAAGTYYYAVIEQAGELGGVAYDDAIYHVTVTVRDNGNGQLVATTALSDAAGTAADAIRFVNEYTAESATAEISGTKTLTGRDLAKGEFSFELYQTGADFAIDGLTAIEIKQNGADGSFKFAPFTFDRAGTYYYAVIEQAGELGGVTYDSTVYCITVIVSDNGDGTLVARTIITNSEGTTAPIVFVNAYEAEDADVSLSGTKTLTGRDLKAGEFSFSLFATDSGFSITGLTALETVSNAANGSFAFTKLTYDAAGTYYYAVIEQAGELGGVTYDSTVYRVTVTVTDNGEGDLIAAVESIVRDGESVEAITFTNDYTAKDTAITLSGKKILVGRALTEGEFTFSLYAANESFEAVGEALIATNAADGSFSFADVTVEAAGTYRFIIVEKTGDLDRMTYDATVYQITVTVVDNGEGSLKVAETVICKAGSTDAEPEVAFVNTYTPKPADVTVDVKVEKTVQNLGNITMTPEGFEFLLQDPAGGDPISLITDALGKATVTLTFTEDDVGKTYTYELYEVKGAVEGMTYSEAVYTVTVTISLDESTNMLVASLTVNGEDTDAVVAAFENVYDFDEVPQTGDNLMLWMGLLAVSCGAILTMGTRRRKKLHAED